MAEDPRGFDVQPPVSKAREELAALTSERDRLREALRDIIEIGKRDMTNPKYDVYFETARAALDKDAKG